MRSTVKLRNLHRRVRIGEHGLALSLREPDLFIFILPISPLRDILND